MKKTLFLLMAACLFAVSCSKNQAVSYEGPYEFSGQLDASEFVDLGLSVKWASCNLGACLPEDGGFCYQWCQLHRISGKASLKDYPEYDSSTKKYAEPYNTSGAVLLTEDDAASAFTSGRIPTPDEIKELQDKCDWLYVRYNGVLGFVVAGTNGKKIFLPSFGYLATDGKADTDASYGVYWSNTLSSSTDCAIAMTFSTKQFGRGQANRYLGCPIRAVADIN